MKKSFALMALATLSLFLFGCGGAAVSLGGLNFTAPSAWTISNQTESRLDFVYTEGEEAYPFTVKYAEANASAAKDLLLEDLGDLQIYQLGSCSGFLCYGVVSSNSAGILTFTEGDNTSSLNEYYVTSDAQSFAKSAHL